MSLGKARLYYGLSLVFSFWLVVVFISNSLDIVLLDGLSKTGQFIQNLFFYGVLFIWYLDFVKDAKAELKAVKKEERYKKIKKQNEEKGDGE